MSDFRVVRNPKSWVWYWFTKGTAEAKCLICLKVLRSDRSTSTLIAHLTKRHGVNKETPPPCSTELPTIQPVETSPEMSSDIVVKEEENPEVSGAVIRSTPLEESGQPQIDIFLDEEHTLRSEMLRLICESNVTLNQMVSEPMRRILRRAYPFDPPPPKSVATLRKIINEEAIKVRNKLRMTLSDPRLMNSDSNLSCE